MQNIIPQSLQNDFFQDLNWFQNEYAKGGTSQYYANASRENIHVIESFIRYIRKKKYAANLDVEKISEYLQKIYVR